MQLHLAFSVALVRVYQLRIKTPGSISIHTITVMAQVHDTGGTTEVRTVDRADYGLKSA